MRIVIIIAALLVGLLVPAFAADTPGALETRVKALENHNAALTEDLGNTRLDLKQTKLDLKQTKTELTKSIADEADARKALEQSFTDQMAKLQKMISDEIAARGESDKRIAELQAKLSDQALSLTKLQSDLDAEKAARMKADIALTGLINHNHRVQKTNTTITYGLAALLAIGLAVR